MNGGLGASLVLRERRGAIAERVTNLYFEARPDLEQRWKGARQKCTEDNRRHLDYLAEALSFARPVLFTEYVVWVATLLARLNIPGEALALNLTMLRTTLASELDGAGVALAAEYLDEAIRSLDGPVTVPPSHIQGAGPLDIMARDYLAALLRGDRYAAGRMILDAAGSGTSVRDIYLLVFQRVQYEIGRLWQMNEISVAQEHYCTACTQSIMSQLYPRIFSAERNGRRLVSTCVGGDLHEIGVRMVTDCFEMEGWDTFYLGANNPIPGVLQQVAAHKPDVLAISATMSFHVQAVADLIAAVRAIGNPPRILVGGAPFNSLSELWKDVGADACSPDAASAVALAEGWAP